VGGVPELKGLSVFAVCLATFCVAQTPARRALLIGNGNYQLLPKNETPFINVQTLEGALSVAGFTVESHRDLDQRELIGVVSRFADSVQPGDIVVFFFSGCGMQVNEVSYLLPVNFNPSDDTSPGQAALSVRNILTSLEERKAGSRIILLDASRPCAPLAEGLAFEQVAAPAVLAFAAQPGQSALDPPDKQANIFTRVLAESIKEPGSTPMAVLMKVQTDVPKRSNNSQQPVVLGSPMSDFFFVNPPQVDKHQTNVPWRNPADNQDYLWIPPGTFQMGCVPDDKKCDSDENPRHTVRITEGFWMGRTEVTVDAYLTFVKMNPNKMRMPRAPLSYRSWNNAGGLPMVVINWGEAETFCKAARGRLPTEAEWEYAARATTETTYPWGNQITHDQAQFNSPIRGSKTGRDISEGAATAQHYIPNNWGLFDVVGNVREWVSDWYKSAYDEQPSNDPQGPPDGKDKILRSGSFHSNEEGVRLSKRDHRPPQDSDNQSGFRCLVASQEQERLASKTR
jgi:sulfatase modifying factor 1